MKIAVIHGNNVTMEKLTSLRNTIEVFAQVTICENTDSILNKALSTMPHSSIIAVKNNDVLLPPKKIVNAKPPQKQSYQYFKNLNRRKNK